MATVSTLRRILDRKQWEPCTPCPAGSTIGSFIVSSSLDDQYQYYILSNTLAYLYDPAEDSWLQLPYPALVGTFGAGSSGVCHPWGPRAFATGGTTTTIMTNLNLQRDLRGYSVRILAGPNIGEIRKIKSNTLGANAVITVDAAYSTAITAASEFVMLTGRVWVVNGGSTAVGSFKYYDPALNIWANAPVGAPSSLATDSKLVVTPGLLTDFVTDTATGATATTLVNTGKNWGVNQWANFQVRIVAGPGMGQIRSIISNTANTLTVAAWTTQPTAASNYVIEGNSDYLYCLGNNAVTMYRYSFSAGTWTTLAPTVARSGAPVAGMSANWVWNVDDSEWNDPNIPTPMNGRFIYSFRGSDSRILDRYNIATNLWENDIVYAPKGEALAASNYYVYAGRYIYIHLLNTGRWLKFNLVENRMEPFSQLWYMQSTAHLGDRGFGVDYKDGNTVLKYLYMITHNQQLLFRTLIF